MENTQTPKNFFLQLGIIASLYVSTISFLTFLFNIIDYAFPKTDIYAYASYGDGVRYSISVLIVVFPLFIWLSRIHRKASQEEKEGKLRKWLLFLTVFLTGIAMAVDLVVLINTFLRGQDLTTSFILKVIAVLFVAGGIFYFYMKDIKGYWNENASKAKTISYVVSAVVLLSVIGGFLVIGSPATARKEIQDSQRISDLSMIQSQVVYFYQLKGKLPTDLTVLKDPLSGTIIPTDPVTKKEYEYKVVNNLSFEICADFSLSHKTKEGENIARTYSIYDVAFLGENWDHGEGRTCFKRIIDPERYPRLSPNNTIKVAPPAYNVY